MTQPEELLPLIRGEIKASNEAIHEEIERHYVTKAELYRTALAVAISVIGALIGVEILR